MNYIKFMMMALMMCFINLSHASIFSTYRSTKRDIKTANEISDGIGSMPIILVLVVLSIGLFFYFRNQKKEKLKKIEKENEMNKLIKECEEKLLNNKIRNSDFEKIKSIYDKPLTKKEMSSWYSQSQKISSKLESSKYILEKAESDYERYKKLLFKYGNEKGETIYNQQFYVGMTKEEVIDSKNGEPTKIETQTLKTKTKEIWIYGNKSSGDVFVFVDGKVERFADK